MATVKAGTVRRSPEGLTAIKTGHPAALKHMAWFVFDVVNGGWYTDGEREGVAEWRELTE